MKGYVFPGTPDSGYRCRHCGDDVHGPAGCIFWLYTMVARDRLRAAGVV